MWATVDRGKGEEEDAMTVGVRLWRFVC